MERAMKELFGQRLREQRQNQGLTMEQLAEKANLSTNFIGAIERGLKEPSLSTLISILNALDIPADVLLRDYVGTASHVTDDEMEEICKRLEGLTPIQKKAALDLLDTYIANLPYLTNKE
jgi:transcriptional regulator with XRE-family HTH domain